MPQPLSPSGNLREIQKEKYHFASTEKCEKVMEEISSGPEAFSWEQRLVVAFACARTCEKKEGDKAVKKFFAGKGKCGAAVVTETWMKEALELVEDKGPEPETLAHLYLVEVATLIEKCEVICSMKGLRVLKDKKGINWKVGLSLVSSMCIYIFLEIRPSFFTDLHFRCSALHLRVDTRSF